jgi:hypothetical protein
MLSMPRDLHPTITPLVRMHLTSLGWPLPWPLHLWTLQMRLYVPHSCHLETPLMPPLSELIAEQPSAVSELPLAGGGVEAL